MVEWIFSSLGLASTEVSHTLMDCSRLSLGYHSSREHTARSLPPKQAQLLRDNVNACIKDLKQSNKSNLSNKQHYKNDSIGIIPADKGNSTVIMDKSCYKKKDKKFG